MPTKRFGAPRTGVTRTRTIQSARRSRYARSHAQIGELLDARGDVEGAAKAYADSLAIEPNADVEQKLIVGHYPVQRTTVHNAFR